MILGCFSIIHRPFKQKRQTSRKWVSTFNRLPICCLISQAKYFLRLTAPLQHWYVLSYFQTLVKSFMCFYLLHSFFMCYSVNVTKEQRKDIAKLAYDMVKLTYDRLYNWWYNIAKRSQFIPYHSRSKYIRIVFCYCVLA